MNHAALTAHPVPHSQTCDTFRAASCVARRTGRGSPSLVGFDIPSPVPAGLVAELVAEHRPSRVEHGFCHPRLGELGRVHIADDDQCVLASDPCRPLVEMVAPGVGDLGMDCPHTRLIVCAARLGERSLISSVVAKGRDFGSIAALGQLLETEVDTDLAGAGGQLVGNRALEGDVPAPACVLHEATSLELTGDLARFPEVELALR